MTKSSGVRRRSLLTTLFVGAAALFSGAPTVEAGCGKMPFVKVPEVLGLDHCVGNNKGEILKILLKSTFKCSIIELVKLSKSNPLKKMIAVGQEIVAAPEKMSATLYDMMVATGESEMNAFCNDWSQLMSPCMASLIPDFLKMVNKDTQCCGELSDVLDMLNLIVPPTVSKESFILNEVVDGISQFMCAPRDDAKQKCGTTTFKQLTTKYTKDEFRLLDSFLLPFFTASHGQECDAFQGKDYTSSASLEAAPVGIDFSCCVDHMRPLLESVQRGFEFALGNTPFEFLNGVVEFSKDKAQFVNALEGAKGCQYAAKCSNPPKLINYKKKDITPGTNKPKTNELKDTDCKRVQKCDASGKLCSEICETGSVTVPEWTKNSLAYQRSLANRQPLCFAQIPATHNSAISLADGFGNRDQLMNANLNPSKEYSYMKTNNQILSVVDQLNVGVRWVEMDVHYFLNELRMAHCGGLGSHSIDVLYDVIKEQLSKYGEILWGPELLGCFPSLSGIRADEQPTTNSSMSEIRDWLVKDENKNELVFVYIDSGREMRKLNKFDDLSKLLQDVFGDLILPRSELEALSKADWKGKSIQDFIDAGHRVVLIGNDHTDLLYRLKDFCHGHEVINLKYMNDMPDKERKIGGVKQYSDDYFVRAYGAVLRFISLNDAGQLSQELSPQIDSSNADKLVRWNVNLVAPDSIDTANMRAQIWSWAENEPSVTGANATVSIGKDGRWRASMETPKTHKACWNGKDLTWNIVEFANDCDEGYTFTGPQDPYQNFLLHQIIVAQNIEDAIVINSHVEFEEPEDRDDSVDVDAGSIDVESASVPPQSDGTREHHARPGIIAMAVATLALALPVHVAMA